MTPQQRDMFTKRWRRVRQVEPAEHQIQMSLIQHLKYRARPDVEYFHVPNGELRDKRAAAKLKAMGTRPGVADLVFVWYDREAGALRNLFLELKAAGRRQSPEQKFFAERVRAAQASYEVADTIDEALAILHRHDLLAR